MILKCPICLLPLNAEGGHINATEAWDAHTCEYYVKRDGDKHPPLTDSLPQVVLDDEIHKELRSKHSELDDKIAVLEKKLKKLTDERSVITGTMVIRQLKVIDVEASIPEDVGPCINWCACVRCKKYRMELAEQEQEVKKGASFEAIINAIYRR